MSLTSVRMSEEVWLTCLSHALTTEKEEIMGLLLGDIQYVNSGSAIALIWGASPQMRSDRRKDRVETNPEQLAAASAEAEISIILMTRTTGKTTRVIGWYHSHPHITVLPSHVDVRTQAMYQLLDTGFIGLIFSCFSEDAQKVGRIQVIAFQSLDGKQRNVSPVNNSSVVEVESSWTSSENMKSASALAIESLKDTCDSSLIKPLKVLGRSSDLEESFSHDDANYLGKQRMRETSLVPYNAENLSNTGLDLDSMDMTASMQEALHRSNMDMSGADYVRKEVPLQVLPAKALLSLDSPLASFIDMQRVLFEEERLAYNQAISQNMRNGKIHPLAYIHHTSTYQASLCKLMEYCLSPAVNALKDRLKENEIRSATLVEEARSLELEALSSERVGKAALPRRSSPPRVHGSSVMGQKGRRGSPDSAGSRSPSGIGSRRKAP
ncbi:uncharacterized protein M6B38_283085 [Iris pallida]|uniref:MPN domain-containing protein n=1 Tax=Iris pallida TaxID=29817 RepID=A0AAX6F3C1_IRIPA|nr:uncharacterized protein M6B38_103970 [Iris pallida]KAJ6846750.1 uncharacterized protein M6B38_283085 [Iris pallida]